MAGDLNLSNLKPAQARKTRKRVGRGLGSGKGRYSGRGIKGQKSRSGSHAMRAGFEGGQMPAYMRMGKQRGSTSKDAMPMGPHRTQTQPVNVAALEERFDAGADVTLEALVEKGLIKSTKIDVKLLGQGELKKKLSITVHAASASAREKVEAAGGELTLLREPKVRRPKRKPQSARPAPAADEPEQEQEETEPQAEETGPEAEGEPDPEPEPEGEEG
jgi:large subunit ribosomal protein L15